MMFLQGHQDITLRDLEEASIENGLQNVWPQSVKLTDWNYEQNTYVYKYI